MGLSCYCDDFDKSEHTKWFEPGRRSVPQPDETCCECNAPLPAETCQSILCGEVYEPDVEMPPHPEDVLGDEPSDINLARHWDQRYSAMEAERDELCDKYGWDDECERFERYSVQHRCERCEDLASAIEDIGYCMIIPGDLMESHCEYVEQSGGAEMIWKPNRYGIWHPRRMTRTDFATREARRSARNALFFVRFGWRLWLRYTVWGAIERRTVAPVMRWLGYHNHYDHERKQMTWHYGPKDDGMTFIRKSMVKCGFRPQWDGAHNRNVWKREKETV